jgi:Flp pilus assembly protein TadB
MMKFLFLLIFLSLAGLAPLPAIAAAKQMANDHAWGGFKQGFRAGDFQEKNKKTTRRTERRQQRLGKKLEKWKTKLERADRISLAWVGVLVMLFGGLFIVLGLVIPYIGILFLVIGIIVAFVGLLLTLLLGGLSVEAD